MNNTYDWVLHTTMTGGGLKSEKTFVALLANQISLRTRGHGCWLCQYSVLAITLVRVPWHIPLQTCANEIAHEECGWRQKCDIILGDFSHTLLVLHCLVCRSKYFNTQNRSAACVTGQTVCYTGIPRDFLTAFILACVFALFLRLRQWWLEKSINQLDSTRMAN